MTLVCMKCKTKLSNDSILSYCPKCMDYLSDEETYNENIRSSHVKEPSRFFDRLYVPKAVRKLCKDAPDSLWDYEEGLYEEH